MTVNREPAGAPSETPRGPFVASVAKSVIYDPKQQQKIGELLVLFSKTPFFYNLVPSFLDRLP